MADILTNVFSTFVPQTGTGMLKAFKMSPSSSSCSTLVVGERSVNRSLLLLAAVTAASELGLKVFFFTKTPILSLPSALHHYMYNFSREHLKKIQFVYPRTMEELLQEVARQQESSAVSAVPPSLLIVDGLEGYLRSGAGLTSRFQQWEQFSAAFLSGLLYDTAAFLTQSLEQKATEGLAPCRVIASFQSEWEGLPGGEPSAPDPILSVLDRYFQVRCTLDQDNGSGTTGAGLQDVWHVYLSGASITEATCAAEGQKEEEEKDPRLAREWRLVIHPSGSMEFTMVHAL